MIGVLAHFLLGSLLATISTIDMFVMVEIVTFVFIEMCFRHLGFTLLFSFFFFYIMIINAKCVILLLVFYLIIHFIDLFQTNCDPNSLLAGSVLFSSLLVFNNYY